MIRQSDNYDSDPFLWPAGLLGTQRDTKRFYRKLLDSVWKGKTWPDALADLPAVRIDQTTEQILLEDLDDLYPQNRYWRLHWAACLWEHGDYIE